MKTFLQIKDEVKDILDDTTLDVDTYVNSAISYVSNFFQNSIIQAIPNQTGSLIDVPERMFSIQEILIDDDYVKKLSNIEDGATAKKLGVSRWYNTSKTIYFTSELDDSTVIIKFEQKFEELTLDVDESDVPDNIIPLVVTCACWMYYKKISSAVNASRQKYPDVDPDEIRRARDTYKKDFDTMLMNLQLEL